MYLLCKATILTLHAHMRAEIVLVTTARPTLYIPSSTTWLFTNARLSGGPDSPPGNKFPAMTERDKKDMLTWVTKAIEFKFEVTCGL